MITSNIAMQNAILSRNIAISRMMATSNNMLSSVSFGYSQPLRPSFTQSNADELTQKSEETKISVLQKIIDAINNRLGKDVKKSTPKYNGIDYKA